MASVNDALKYGNSIAMVVHNSNSMMMVVPAMSLQSQYM